MATFSTPAVKKAIKVAQDLGLPVVGFEVLTDGTIRVMTAMERQNEADAALDQWMRSRNG